METTHDNAQQHPLLNLVANLSDQLDKATTVNPTFVSTADKAVAMRELSTIVSRTQGLLLSVLAASGDVAEDTGARCVGDWYAAATRHDHRPSVGLCSHHHHRAHDTRYLTKLLPNGDHRFTRRN